MENSEVVQNTQENIWNPFARCYWPADHREAVANTSDSYSSRLENRMKKVTLDTDSLSLLSAPFILRYLDFQYFIEISVYCTVFAFIIAIFQNSGFSGVRLSKLVTLLL